MKRYLTPTELKRFPVKNLSNSSIRCFITNQWRFYQTYVKGMWDEDTSPALVEGKIIHRGIELIHTQKMNSDKPINVEALKEILQKDLDKAEPNIRWGKTGSYESTLATIFRTIDFYLAELPDDKVISLEETLVENLLDLDGDEMPIKVKGVIDMIAEDASGQWYIKDHKNVSAFSTSIGYDYVLQGTLYCMLVKKRYNKEVKKVIFQEIKKSKNRDGSPQIKCFEVNIGSYEIYRFQELYKRVVRNIAGRPTFNKAKKEDNLIPNFYDMFFKEEDLNVFFMETLKEVDNKEIENKGKINNKINK